MTDDCTKKILPNKCNPIDLLIRGLTGKQLFESELCKKDRNGVQRMNAAGYKQQNGFSRKIRSWLKYYVSVMSQRGVLNGFKSG